jgi:hypothetical protein
MKNCLTKTNPSNGGVWVHAPEMGPAFVRIRAIRGLFFALVGFLFAAFFIRDSVRDGGDWV